MQKVHIPIIAALAVLSLSGGLKVFSAFSDAKVLDALDPILQVANRSVFILVGSYELMLCLLLVGLGNNWVTRLLLLWFISSCITYQVSLALIGWTGHCKCLGNLFEWFPWLARFQESVLLGALLVLTLATAWLYLADKLLQVRQTNPNCAQQT